MTTVASALDEAGWINWTLERPRRIAVVGLSNREERDSYRASLYLHESGYEIVPVNPGHSSVMGLNATRASSMFQAPSISLTYFNAPIACPRVLTRRLFFSRN